MSDAPDDARRHPMLVEVRRLSGEASELVADLHALDARMRGLGGTAEAAAESTSGVTAEFDERGVLSALRIDEATRAVLDEEALSSRIAEALRTAPVPATVLRADPAALLAALGDAAHPAATRTAEGDGLTVVLLLGRPIDLRVRPGALLGRSTTEIEHDVVRLVRSGIEEWEGDHVG